MKFFRRIIISASAILLILSSVFAASAITYDYEGEVESETVLLVNMDTGITVYDKNADKVRFPASLTKIMTFIIVSENVDDFENTRVKIRKEAIDPLLGTGSMTSGVDQKVGETMTVMDLVHCMLVTSGNDAAMVLADYVGGGSIEKFVDMMNEKATELGCLNTHFMNPHGLHDEMHYSTARDFYTIASYAMTLPLFTEITNTATYYCEGDDYPQVTTNSLIDANRGGDYYYTYARGVKTGTTDQAGRCVITTGIADGYAYMCICMGAPYENSDHNGAFVDAKNLLRWALLDLELSRMLTVETPVCEIAVNFSSTDNEILLYPKENVNTILPKEYDEKDVKIQHDIPESIDAPIKKGDYVGTATVYYKDEKIKTVELVAGEDIERSGVAYAVHTVKVVVTSWPFWIAVAVAGALIVLYIILAANVRTKKKKVKKYRKL